MQGPTDGLPWEGPGVGAGAGPSAAGGSALQPWGDSSGGATAGASGGRERSGNAEITPLEVLKPALPELCQVTEGAQCSDCTQTSKAKQGLGTIAPDL